MEYFLALLAIWFVTTLDRWPSYPPMFNISDYGYSISECLDDVPADGGIVWIPPGVYTIPEPKQAPVILGYNNQSKER